MYQSTRSTSEGLSGCDMSSRVVKGLRGRVRVSPGRELPASGKMKKEDIHSAVQHRECGE